jgi:DNA-binding MarR family transcriptional regulator
MFMIMHIIEQSGSEPITLSEIAETQEVTKSAISRKVGTLLDLGLIEQKSDRVDRRKKYLTLTNRGRELYWKNDKIFKEMLDDVAKRYGKDDFLKTLEHINKIVEVIKDTMDN